MTTLRIPPLSAMKRPDGVGLPAAARSIHNPPRPMPGKSPAAVAAPVAPGKARLAPKPQPKLEPGVVAPPSDGGDPTATPDAAPKTRTGVWLGGSLLVLALCGAAVGWQIMQERKAAAPASAVAVEPTPTIAAPHQKQLPALAPVIPPAAPATVAPAGPDTPEPAPDVNGASANTTIDTGWDLLLQGR